MSDYQKVLEFTKAAGQTCSSKPSLMKKEEVKFLIRMIMSECQELADTVCSNPKSTLELLQTCLNEIDVSKHVTFKNEIEHIAAQGDAGVDIWVYILNAFAKKGVDLSQIFNEVMESNMRKRDPTTGKFIIRESDGKIMKPPGWKPPDVEGVIKKLFE